MNGDTLFLLGAGVVFIVVLAWPSIKGRTAIGSTSLTKSSPRSEELYAAAYRQSQHEGELLAFQRRSKEIAEAVATEVEARFGAAGPKGPNL